LLLLTSCVESVGGNSKVDLARGDVDFGWPLLRQLVELDVGQSMAVRDRDVIAVEAIEGTDAMIERMAVWRDILHRPAADGMVEWRLGSHAFLVLGDFPSGSRDSRHWGPLGRSALCNRARPLD
jgi:type IV secretory pathway protease TraF